MATDERKPEDVVELDREGQGEFVSLAGIAPDFTDGETAEAYIKGRWQ